MTWRQTLSSFRAPRAIARCTTLYNLTMSLSCAVAVQSRVTEKSLVRYSDMEQMDVQAEGVLCPAGGYLQENEEGDKG